MERFETALSENMAGQSQAFHVIRKALARNVDKFANENPNPPDIQSLRRTWQKIDRAVGGLIDSNSTTYKALSKYVNIFEDGLAEPAAGAPLFMHFSGPTGVGKTMTAEIIARSMFTGASNSAQELCGRLSFLMRDFASPRPSDMEQNVDKIRSMVAEQLYHCPRSVIIFDEVQALPELVLDRTIDMFDHQGLSFEGRAVNTSRCVVIVISDMGSTKLSPDMPRIAAREAIEEDARERFQRSQKKVLLNNIVPFLPLSVEELATVAVMELKHLNAKLAREYRGVWGGTITWNKQVPPWLAESCFSESTCYDDGGRGMETLVEHEVRTAVEDALLGECGGGGVGDAVSYNNIDIAVEDGQAEVVAKVDTVFDARKEFREL